MRLCLSIHNTGEKKKPVAIWKQLAKITTIIGKGLWIHSRNLQTNINTASFIKAKAILQLFPPFQVSRGGIYNKTHLYCINLFSHYTQTVTELIDKKVFIPTKNCKNIFTFILKDPKKCNFHTNQQNKCTHWIHILKSNHRNQKT